MGRGVVLPPFFRIFFLCIWWGGGGGREVGVLSGMVVFFVEGGDWKQCRCFKTKKYLFEKYWGKKMGIFGAPDDPILRTSCILYAHTKNTGMPYIAYLVRSCGVLGILDFLCAPIFGSS